MLPKSFVPQPHEPRRQLQSGNGAVAGPVAITVDLYLDLEKAQSERKDAIERKRRLDAIHALGSVKETIGRAHYVGISASHPALNVFRSSCALTAFEFRDYLVEHQYQYRSEPDSSWVTV